MGPSRFLSRTVQSIAGVIGAGSMLIAGLVATVFQPSVTRFPPQCAAAKCARSVSEVPETFLATMFVVGALLLGYGLNGLRMRAFQFGGASATADEAQEADNAASREADKSMIEAISGVAASISSKGGEGDDLSDSSVFDPAFGGSGFLRQARHELLKARLAAAIRELPDRERVIVRRRYYEGFGERAIGAEFGIGYQATTRILENAVSELARNLGIADGEVKALLLETAGSVPQVD